MKSLVSIIIPCYNQAQYLSEALQSVLDQTYSDWECIIVNDGSPDNTKDVVLEWLNKDTRFRYVEKENGGLSSARNAGLDKATGDYIQFLDADDIIASEKLQESIEAFNLKSDLDVVITDYNMFFAINSPKSAPFYSLSKDCFNFETILNEWDVSFTIPIHCGIFKRRSIGGLTFNENLKAKEDWLFWIQFFKKCSSSIFIDKQLASYRKHIGSMTHSATYVQESLDKVWVLIREELNSKEYELFLLNRLKFYKYRYLDISSKYSNLKNGLTYRFALKLKNVLQTLGLYTIAKSGLQKLRK